MKKSLQRGKEILASLALRLPSNFSTKSLPTASEEASFFPTSQDILIATQRVEETLESNIIPFWFPHVIDRINGGYRSYHRLEGGWKGPRSRCLVAQARVLWFFSRLTRSRWGMAGHLEAARHGFQFLRDVMWDQNFGGFYWEMAAVKPTPQKSNKNVYGQAFGLYALSEYAKISEDPSALELAKQLFSLLDTQVHDSQYGGYYELCTCEWEPIPLKLSSSPNSLHFIKTMNTHLHLMEAFTTYFMVSQDPIARERLIELLFILSNAVLRKRIGACTDKYFPDWTPLPGKDYEQISYGHDLEILWLLSETCDAIGFPKEPFFDLYQTIFDYANHFGFDPNIGGIYEYGYFNKQAHKRKKIWWVQAEGLVSSLHLYHLMKKEKYWKGFTQTLKWILTHQVDGEHEDWHRSVEPNGCPTGYWYDAWKAPYHNGRAMLQCSDILTKLYEG